MTTGGPHGGTGDSYTRAPDPASAGFAKLPWAVFIVVLIVMGLGRYLEYRVNGEPPGGWASDIIMGLAFMSFPAVGALVASRRRATAFGWLLLGIGGAAAVLVAASAYAAWRVPAGHSDALTVLSAWIYAWLWFPLIFTIPTFLFLLFPTGSYPSARWRWVGRATLLLIVLITVPAMLQDKLEVEHCPKGGQETCTTPAVDNPIGLSVMTDTEQQLGFLFVAVIPLILLSVGSMFIRYRAADTVQRQQMKWVGVAAALFGASLILGETFGLAEVIFPFLLMLLPASMAISILKYRLYEIDVILNRTLVYAVLTGILVLAYLGIVFVLQQVMSGITQDSDLAVAGSTLAVAAMFRPLRVRVQGFIDRRFYRRKYDSQRTLEGFSSRLRDDVDLEHLARDLTGVVHETMQPAHVSVWLRGQEEVRPS